MVDSLLHQVAEHQGCSNPWQQWSIALQEVFTATNLELQGIHQVHWLSRADAILRAVEVFSALIIMLHEWDSSLYELTTSYRFHFLMYFLAYMLEQLNVLNRTLQQREVFLLIVTEPLPPSSRRRSAVAEPPLLGCRRAATAKPLPLSSRNCAPVPASAPRPSPPVLCDRADGFSLFDLTSGASPAPPATADSTVRSQWATRDAAARLAVRRHLPTTERAHFSQYRSAQTLYDAVVARYSSPATAALSRLFLPYLFPDHTAFPTVTDLITHLCTSDTRYRAALPAEFCAKNPPPMYLTLYYIVTRLPDSLRSDWDHFLSVCPTSLTVDLLEERLLAAEQSIVAVGASRGDPRTPVFQGCSHPPLLPSVASAAAADLVGFESVGAASAPSGRRRPGRGKGGRGAGGASGGSGGSGGGGSRGGGGGSGRGGRGGGVGSSGEASKDRTPREVCKGDCNRPTKWRKCGAVSKEGAGGTRVKGEGTSSPTSLTTSVPLTKLLGGRGLTTALLLLALTITGTTPLRRAATSATAASATSASSASTAATDASTPATTPTTTPAPSTASTTTTSTVLPCPAAPSGTLSGLYLRSFSTNLVSAADLQDQGFDQFTPARQRVTHCTCARTGRHLATFTRRPGWSLYTLSPEYPPVPPSGQVAASSQVVPSASGPGPVSAPCSCRLLSHQTLLWHHRLGHPSLPRLRGMASRVLVSGLPRSLPPLPSGPTPTCVPCVEGQQRAAPHSSEFPPTEAPLQTLHMDVSWSSRSSRSSWLRSSASSWRSGWSRSSWRSRSSCRGRSPAESGGAEPGGAEPGSAEPGGEELGGAGSTRVASRGASSRRELLSPQELREWFARRWSRAAGAGGTPRAGGTGGAAAAAGVGPAGASGAAGAGAASGVGAGDCPAGGTAGAAGGTGAAGPAGVGAAGASGARGAGAAAGVSVGGSPGAGSSAGAGVGAVGAGGAAGTSVAAGGTGAVPAGSGGPARPRPYFVPLLEQVLGLPPSSGPSLECPQPVQSQSLFQPVSPLPAPSPYTGPTGGLAERREPASRPASPVHAARTSGRAPRQRPPARVPLPSPPASSLPVLADPESDSLRAVSPTVARLLSTVVTDPSFVSAAASALVAELVHFAACCRLDYAAGLVAESASVCPPSVGGECALSTDVLEDRQEEFQCFAAALPHLVSLLIAPEGDPDAPDIPTPRSYAEAIEGPYSSQWQSAMDAEMASWKSTGTYVDEVPPPGANIVSGMWIFRVKRPPGSPPVFKARYVARGFSQRQGVYYFQTFSPTPKMTTLWVLLHVAAQRDYELHSLDFSTAFLQGSLHEEIWLRRPPGFTGSFPPGTQWSLRRPVYGLRQAPREWHDTLRTTLATLGFPPSTANPSLFLRTDTSLPPFYILVYVDDLVFATADTAGLAHVKSELQKRHTCTDLGELRSYLGLQITRDRAQRTITLTQSHMVQQVLQRFDFTYSLPQATPLSTRHSLSALPSDESVESSGPYPELVGCLMYLMTCTRPDLAYPLSILARYVAPGRHRPKHMAAAKRVLRYLCSTSGLGLVLGGRRPVVLTGHADASWADDQATQRSSQGYTFSLGSGSVSWRSARSSSFLGSSCEAEIYAGAMAAQELRWLTYLLTDLGEQPRSSPVLYVDNKAMLALCREHRLEHRTKHIALRYFLARELQQRGQLRLAYVASQANTADIFTKALPPAHVKSELQKRHTCTDLGELRRYLGLQITRDRAQRTITLTLSHMVQQVLQRFDFTYSSPQATPLSTRHSLSALPSDESVESSGPYSKLVGCLMYLMTCTRPDLAYPLSILARYVAPGRHRPEHMAAAKRVLRYLCSTSGLGLVLGGRRPVVLTGHADASWADDQATQRSSQGYTFSLGSGSVSWRSTRSSSVLGSSCEAEIYAGTMAAQELRWLTYLLTNLGEQPSSPLVLYVENKAMLALCREHRLEHRTTHIALRYFLARELQQRGQLRLAYVASQANTADIFTKALPPGDHQRFCTLLGLVPTWPNLLTS
ncbi:unnamed protein product [Closterium sp. NIES-54]